MKTIRNLFVTLFVILGFHSCEKEGGNQAHSFPSASTGANNYKDLAVTGGLNYVSYTCAEIIGYANLGSFALAGVEFGIIISEENKPDENNGTIFKANILEEGRKFTIPISYSDNKHTLNPDTKYFYKSYVNANGVKVYGEIKYFTTPKVPSNILHLSKITDVGYGIATVLGYLDMEDFHPKDLFDINYYIYSDGEIEIEETLRWSGNESRDLAVTFQELNHNSTYSCIAEINFPKTNTKILCNTPLSFKTLDGSDLFTIKEQEIGHTTATYILHLNEDKLKQTAYWVHFWYRESESPDYYEFYDFDMNDGYTMTVQAKNLRFGTKYNIRVGLLLDERYDGNYPNASSSTGYIYYDNITPFTTKDVSNEQMVDLGFNVKWASKNLGAECPLDTGNYYAWGDPTPYNYNTFIYKFDKINHDSYYDLDFYYSKYNSTDKKTTVELEDDAAHKAWGQGWRTPTIEELEQLKQCEWIETSKNGTSGLLCISPNGNSIFFPYAGLHKKSETNTEKYKYLDYEQVFLWSSTAKDGDRGIMFDIYVDYNGRANPSATYPCRDYELTTIRPVYYL